MVGQPPLPDDSARRPSRRVVWGALAVLLALALGLLAWAVAGRDEAAAPAEPETLEFRVVDEQGRPIPHAEVFVLAGDDLPEGGAGAWSDEDATLTLPAAVRGSAIAVQARGYRSAVAQRVTDDVEFVLRHGIVVRFEPRGLDPAALGDEVLVFEVTPVASEGRSEAQRAKIADLIAPLGPAPEGGVLRPAGAPGFAVRAAVAQHGLLFPLAGRYAVRWGLLDPTSEVWFALSDGARALIDVADDPRTQMYPIPVPAEALVRTRKGLGEHVAEVRAR